MKRETSNARISLSFNYDKNIWEACLYSNAVKMSEAKASVKLNNNWFELEFQNLMCNGEVGQDELGRFEGQVFSGDLTALDANVSLHIRRYEDHPILVIWGSLENHGGDTIKVDEFAIIKDALVEIDGGNDQVSAHVARGIAHPNVVPLVEYEQVKDHLETQVGSGVRAKSFHVDSNGMATLTNKETRYTFTMGFITGDKPCRPIVSVRYDPVSDKIRVSGVARFNGISLLPNESVETNRLMVQALGDPFLSLESYAEILAMLTPPRNRKPTVGWCSWYAIRLPISHEFTIANAKIVVDRFRDLGMDIMLLDHGWQSGDICGDWDEDKQDFPKGLEGLSKELKEMGLKLGIWIAPTEVSETSKLFREHPEYVLKDKDGNPQPTWQWYWKPNPQQYQLDATHPSAYRYIRDTFQRLTKAGSAYYKIDFIAGCSGENLYPYDRSSARGWTPLLKAMLAVREGAGDDVYIRYCQTPPLLSVGLADGVFATSDTLDAGATTWDVLREVFKMTSAQYFLHGLYNHDACDLSIRTHAGTEECRLRIMMLAFSGSSIMFSDDLTKLPEERIIMMQQSIPPLQRSARPINLFTSPMPDIWHYQCNNCNIRWDLLALFNFNNIQIEFKIFLEDIGLSKDCEYLVREFWTEEFLGIRSNSFNTVVPGLSARLYSIWKLEDKPQYLGTNLHLSQGEAELLKLSWDEENGSLSGVFKRARGIRGRAYYNVPQGWSIVRSSHHMTRQNGGIWAMELSFDEPELAWEISFAKCPLDK